jgi:hypothetical protein
MTPINTPIIGTIEALTVDDPADTWSGGTMRVGGQFVIIPRNLIIELPANFLTLQQLFAQAPAACVALDESGLATSDGCLAGGVGGVASILANRSAAGSLSRASPVTPGRSSSAPARRGRSGSTSTARTAWTSSSPS